MTGCCRLVFVAELLWLPNEVTKAISRDRWHRQQIRKSDMAFIFSAHSNNSLITMHCFLPQHCPQPFSCLTFSTHFFTVYFSVGYLRLIRRSFFTIHDDYNTGKDENGGWEAGDGGGAAGEDWEEEYPPGGHSSFVDYEFYLWDSSKARGDPWVWTKMA